MRTGIFGGTFDPVHMGHLVSGDQVATILDLDQVIFIPCANPPHKTKPMEDATHRYRMIKSAIRSHTKFKVSSIEMERRGHSYSMDTIMQLRSDCPDWDPLYFIIGIDAFLDIESWKEFEAFLAAVTMVITSRPGYHLADMRKKMTESTLELLEPVPPKFPSLPWGETLHDLKRVHSPGRQIYLKIPSIDISATDIRFRLRKKMSVRYLIPDSVKKYIDKYELYR